MVKDIIASMRPYQWTKNLIIFTAITFSRHLLELPYLLKVSAVFAILCLLSGCIYIINDVLDVDCDRAHPTKSRRPIAAGRLPLKGALLFAGALALVLIACSFAVDMATGFLMLAFLALNVTYSKYLKHAVILDVIAIAASFLLRTFMGGVVIGVEISHWLIICCTFLALFLGFGKRRYELRIAQNGCGDGIRGVLKSYNGPFLDQIISIVTSSTLIFYALYTMAPEVMKKLDVAHLNLTLPFVAYGLFRYLYLVYKEEQGGYPSLVLLSDRGIQASVILWAASVVLILRFHL
jgi:4-hydroxybenzoate polyprenyltransferase